MLKRGAHSGSSEVQSKYSSTTCFRRLSLYRPHMMENIMADRASLPIWVHMRRSRKTASCSPYKISYCDILDGVMSQERMPAPGDRLQILAEFRHHIRLFLHFSETAAQKRGLQAQQHQLLLQIAGAPDKVAATIGYAAERLGLCHNTVVELCNRCEAAGLIARKQAGSDRRCVLAEPLARWPVASVTLLLKCRPSGP
jgi:DNA-binding MarR family transcriptional regulator